jgi:hypothetical protein
MIELTFDKLVEKFDTISNALAVDEFDRPTLEIKMRMNWKEKESRFYVSLNYVEVKDGGILISAMGNGATPEEAMRNYYKQIVGEKLVFHTLSDEFRREYVVI